MAILYKGKQVEALVFFSGFASPEVWLRGKMPSAKVVAYFTDHSKETKVGHPSDLVVNDPGPKLGSLEQVLERNQKRETEIIQLFTAARQKEPAKPVEVGSA